jgi:hypothetical protein
MGSAMTRLDALERADRRARRIVRAAWLAAGLTLLSGQAVSPSSAASDSLLVGDAAGRHVLVTAAGVSTYDAGGRMRMFVGLNASGMPVVQSFDAASVSRQTFGLFADGDPFVRFYDAAHVKRFDDSFTEGGHPSIELDDAQGVDRADLFESTTTAPTFMLRGSDGKQRFYFETNTTGAYLGSKDAAQVVRFYAGLYTDASSGMVVYDTSGAVLWKRP